MVAFASAQIMLLNDVAPAPIVVKSPAYAFGTRLYICLVMTISCFITGWYLYKAMRTRGWRGLSKFDFMDVKSVIIAASGGGEPLRTRLRRGIAHGEEDGMRLRTMNWLGRSMCGCRTAQRQASRCYSLSSHGTKIVLDLWMMETRFP